MTNVLRPQNLLWICVFAVFSICFYARSGYQLLYYPWFYPDSFDWLVNGLAYSGKTAAPFSISHRGMLFTLLSALAFKLNFPNLLLQTGLLCHCLTALVGFSLIKNEVGERTALIASLLYLFLANILAQSAFLGADVPANLLLVATLLYWRKFFQSENQLPIYLAAILSALGIHLQYVGAILAPTFLYVLNLNSIRRHTRSIFLAGGLFALLAMCLLIPRLIKYGVIYTEDVQHLSLLKAFYTGGLHYYLIALPSVFPWPLLLLAFLGLWRNFTQLSKFCLFWILNILLFFSLLYSWTDSRFLIYAAYPLCVLSALGMDACVTKVRLAALRLGFTLAILLISNISLTTYPFDLEIPLTPKLTLIPNPDETWTVSHDLQKPMLLAHPRESQSLRAQFNSPAIDTRYASRPLEELFSKLRGILGAEIQTRKIYYFEPMTGDEWYYVKNRNILYLKSAISTLKSKEELQSVLKSGASIVVVTPAELLPEFPTPTVLASIGRYVALSISYH